MGRFPTSIEFCLHVGIFPTAGRAICASARIELNTMTNSDQNAALSPALLLAAVQRLLRPLVRLMMRNGLTFPVLADALRRLFVDVAATELLTDPRSRTDSRISLLTGVHRKEIRRLRGLSGGVQDVPEIVTMCSEIIARWLATPLFLDE
ncbi:MAG TPA: DUF6502 family protein, partial [Rhodopila sp.]|nr:DUF6502 family protein [Rhodopila sp.]